MQSFVPNLLIVKLKSCSWQVTHTILQTADSPFFPFFPTAINRSLAKEPMQNWFIQNTLLWQEATFFFCCPLLKVAGCMGGRKAGAHLESSTFCGCGLVTAGSNRKKSNHLLLYAPLQPNWNSHFTSGLIKLRGESASRECSNSTMDGL